MTDQTTEKKSIFKVLPRNYWTVIVMEFFERGSYYGVMSILSVYLVLSVSEGGLGFSKESVGLLKSVITPLLYFLPIIAGAMADRYGYRKSLMFAFVVMSIGYTFSSFMESYWLIFGTLIFTMFGAGTFKTNYIRNHCTCYQRKNLYNSFWYFLLDY